MDKPENINTSDSNGGKPTGRPSVYSPELAEEICARLASGEGLRKICESEDMPNASTVHLWVLQDREGFSKQYAQARAIQAEVMFDEILEISDESRKDILGDDKSDNARVQAHKLRVDTRKWYMSKVMPKKYGDKIDHTTNGKEIPIPILGGMSIIKVSGDVSITPPQEDVHSDNGNPENSGA